MNLPKRIYNTLIRKRNKFFLATDDVLQIKVHSEDDVVVLPSVMHAEALKISHDHEGSLHPGVDRTLTILKSRVWWPDMHQDVEDYIRTCNTCIKKDRNPALNTPTLGRTTTRKHPKGKLWSADILSFNRPSGKNTCVITVMEYTTR